MQVVVASVAWHLQRSLMGSLENDAAYDLLFADGTPRSTRSVSSTASNTPPSPKGQLHFNFLPYSSKTIE